MSERYQIMVDVLLELAKKWDIGVLDLWNDSEMRAVAPEAYARYMKNGVHPSKSGYAEWWGPKFTAYLAK